MLNAEPLPYTHLAKGKYWHFRRGNFRARINGDYGSPEFQSHYEELLRLATLDDPVRKIQPRLGASPDVKVYFMGWREGPIKIGIALVPITRLYQAQTYSPYPLELWAICCGGAVQERIYHKRFAAHRLHGEWFDRWFEHVKAPHARLYVELGLATMARPTAILELTWDRVDFERGTVDLNPRGRRQTRKRRPVVPLNDDAVAALKEAWKGRQSQYVVERGAQKIGSIKKAFQAASERSGIHVTPYTLRHTGAVWAAEAGVSMAELAQFMGHDDSTTTEKHYARFSLGHLRRVADAVRRTG